MYHLRVEELGERKMSELVPTTGEDNDYMEVFKEPLDTKECVEFSVGNPRVEHITGIVHLYKRNTPMYGEAWKGHSTPEISEAEVSQTLCCLAIPADMSVAHFCTFIGAYLGEVRSIQVLRREGSQPSVCMVLLTFATQEQADNFFNDFSSLPFSSLEPDILCRLVYVRNVEVLSSRGRPTPVTLPAAAKALTAATATAAPAAASGSAAASDSSSSSGKAPQSSQDTPASKVASASSAAAPAGAASSSEQQPDKQSSQPPAGEQQPAATSSEAAEVDKPAKQPQQQQQQQQQPPQKNYAAVLGGSSASPSAATAGAGAGSGSSPAAAASAMQQWLEPPPGTTELPTCPVCLERLDEHISGIVTTVCNHRFHGECIKHWGDTSCPVCRYCMLSSNASTSRCSTCGTTSNLWICLICGHVGCGRYKQGHANDHWKASAHCYALELETQRVWDYAGDGYVHRLIQSKTDGKLVEVPSPAPTCPHGSPSIHHHHHHRRHHHQHHRQRSHGGGDGGRGSTGDPLSRSRSGSSAAAAVAAAAGGACSSGADTDGDVCTAPDCPVCADENKQMKEALVSSKLEAISLEYNHLLATQLDSQRQYFEQVLAQQDAKQQAALAAARAAAEQAQVASESAAVSAKESDRKRQQLERKLSELTSSLSKVSEEREFLRSLNETLLSNQKDFNSKLAAAQAELKDKDAQLQDLQEQVRDLMVYIEAQRTIQSAGGSELQDATLLPMPQSRGSSSSRSSRRSSKK